MGFTSRLLVVFSAISCCSCLPTPAELISLNKASLSHHNKLRIYHGNTTTIQKHPYIVSIQVYYKYQCQGTIVSDTWVITTADCVNNVYLFSLSIVAGSQDSTLGNLYYGHRIVLNPEYGTNAFDYEYACVQIYGVFHFNDKIQPVKLPSLAPQVGTTLAVAGWGNTAATSDKVEYPVLALYEGNMQWWNKTVCAKLYESAGVTWTDRMACAYNQGETTLCMGDFGDSFIYNGVVYGQFVAGLNPGFCTSDASPILISDISAEVAWFKQVTGAKSQNED